MDFLKKSLWKMTGVELRKAHMALWDWIAKHPRRNKRGYFYDTPYSFGDIPVNYCYACVRASVFGYQERSPLGVLCLYCPCDWGVHPEFWTADFPCGGPDSPYLLWFNARDAGNFEDASKYALMVRDAWPERRV
jgi:hypothetical protein